MAEIRFLLDHSNATEYSDLEKRLKAADPQAQFPTAAPPPGAAMAELVLIALIKGGAAVISACIAAYAAHVEAKAKRSEAAKAPVVIVIRGTEGSETVQVGPNGVDTKAVDAAVKKVGTVTEVTHK